MRSLSDLVSDDEAVSSIIGEILMTGIAVLIFAIIAVSVFSMLDPVEEPHIDVDGWPNNYTDKIHIRHEGGEKLSTEDLKLIVEVNDTRKSYTGNEIKDDFHNKDTWQIADTISVDISEEFGQEVTYDKDIEFTLIHTKSSTVIENGVLTSSKVGTGDGSGDGDDGGDGNGNGNGNGDGTVNASERVKYVDDSVNKNGANFNFSFSVNEGEVTIDNIELYLVNEDGPVGYNNIKINEREFTNENINVPEGINHFLIISDEIAKGGPGKEDISVKFIFGDGSEKLFDEWQ
ncbi:Protein of unknown function DUF1628 [Methanohalobium evestigatum Z-7303]|uniref:Archaeal Type IV pilin N-terminal domain-containing protein n=1 Tax=Methanohalobium evestigatum (strain ATCC BAA-1072 / DSM 3721 / NBRC 107634 / OCM 161 / Z-7303) TaxID=644295 RepID=D7E8I1_METEZ|nr:type IV pilin N-terminal domain-containing protein [Methanohalobium evestigatum]ADI73523.1 Protein of unknown function DUF1628 [Methanohalobium evestigatum Z-7303]